MTRDEIIATANNQYNAVIQRCNAERQEIERQRLAALTTIPGAAPILAAYAAAVKKAEKERARAHGVADAAVQEAIAIGSDGRYVATGKAIDALAGSKRTAERTRDSKRALAEQEYDDAFRAADAHPGKPIEREKMRQDARAKRDLAWRNADREYAAAVDAADRQYVDDLATAASTEVETVQGAIRRSSTDKAAADAAFRDALNAAADARHEALIAVPPADAVQQAFDARLAQMESDGEAEKASILAWMKTELGKLG